MSSLFLFAFACSGAGDDSPTDSGPSAQVVYHRDVAPILNRACASCHWDGRAGPFPLESHGDAALYAQWMAANAVSRFMPPWAAGEVDGCSPDHAYLHDTRLTEEEALILLAWSAGGAPEGDPADGEVPEEPQEEEIPSPDLLLSAAEPWELPHDPDEPEDALRCLMLDPGHLEDLWVSSVQIHVGNAASLMAAQALIVPAGQVAGLAALQDEAGGWSCPALPQLPDLRLLTVFIPGTPVLHLPEGSALALRAGEQVLLRIHHRIRREEDPGTDQTAVALQLTGVPAKEAAILVLGNAEGAPILQGGPDDPDGEPAFVIPANRRHTEIMHLEADPAGPDRRVWAAGAWMHTIGDAATLRLLDDGGSCAFAADAWEPHWPQLYRIDAAEADLPIWRAGETLELSCTYANQLPNAGLEALLEENGLDEPIEVGLGDGPLDENCLAFVALVEE